MRALFFSRRVSLFVFMGIDPVTVIASSRRFQMDRVALLCVVLAVAHAGQPLAVPQSFLTSDQRPRVQVFNGSEAM